MNSEKVGWCADAEIGCVSSRRRCRDVVVAMVYRQWRLWTIELCPKSTTSVCCGLVAQQVVRHHHMSNRCVFVVGFEFVCTCSVVQRVVNLLHRQFRLVTDLLLLLLLLLQTTNLSCRKQKERHHGDTRPSGDKKLSRSFKDRLQTLQCQYTNMATKSRYNYKLYETLNRWVFRCFFRTGSVVHVRLVKSAKVEQSGVWAWYDKRQRRRRRQEMFCRTTTTLERLWSDKYVETRRVRLRSRPSHRLPYIASTVRHCPHQPFYRLASAASRLCTLIDYIYFYYLDSRTLLDSK